MICLAEISKYKISYRGIPVEVMRSEDLDETVSDGKVIARIDYANMSKETALALKQYDINAELSMKEFVQTNQDMNNDLTSQNMVQTNQPERGKVYSLNNGHSILGNDNLYPNGFSDRLLISLLAGFGLAAVAATVYIFTNLSKVTFILQ